MVLGRATVYVSKRYQSARSFECYSRLGTLCIICAIGGTQELKIRQEFEI